MSGVFLANLDLGPVLEAVRRNGAAVVAQALGDRFRTRLERELWTVPYEPAPAEVGPVRQETDVFVLRDLKGFPALAELAHEYRVAVLAHAREIRGLATYAPNEIHLQRYRPGSLGITPHLDGCSRSDCPPPARAGSRPPGCRKARPRDRIPGDRASIVDSTATLVDGRHCVLYVWYDNEFGYARQVVRIADELAGLGTQTLPL